MRILTRYLLRAHIGPFIFALVALTGILFVNTIARRFEDLAGKGLPIRIVFEVFVLSLPHILALTLPMAVLVAVLYAFAHLAADNEITALKASGASLVRLLMPLIVVSFLLAGFMIWFNDRVLPDTNFELKNLMSDVAATTPTLELTEQVINQIRTQDYRARYWLKAARIDDETRRMYDIVIYDLSNARKSRTVYADSGRMVLNPQRTDLMLILYDGVLHEVDETNPTELQRVAFHEQHVELKGVGHELQRSANDYRSDREMSVAMLNAVVDSARRELAAVRREGLQISRANLERVLAGPAPAVVMGPVEVPTRPADFPYMRDPRITTGADDGAYSAALEAQRIANQAKTLRDRINQYKVEVHKKFAIPFACIIFVLIGAPLAVRFPRGGVGMVIATSLSIFGIYYISLIGGESLGDRGTIEPFWGPWAPNLLFGIIALWGLSRIGRETATSRSGGWDDLLQSLRDLFLRMIPGRRRRREA